MKLATLLATSIYSDLDKLPFTASPDGVPGPLKSNNSISVKLDESICTIALLIKYKNC